MREPQGGKKQVFITIIPEYKPGDPPPTGYVEWHEWADVQMQAGLSQGQCGTCKRWYFPQEEHR